ncbi:PAS domain S-box protein [Phototrophicus methaneseepsis]|uniref:histidine kinase n=1 Tax=Phototrophicus methaneseepsis TaxID=2710758 RepID=A0A7S8IDX9_9CHLR|nr:PAS domain S-box protein [Phototrophicus methaneseepsis]QPC81283.1 PAS domain S-box protein [Phototrophicus methaneseepsis]
MDKLLRALILEDSQSDTLLLVRQLQRAGYLVEYTRVESAESMTSALEQQEWDIILSDFSMPNFSATAGLELLKQKGLDIPFIIISGTMGEENAVTAMKAGAQDYFPKGKTTRLAAAIDRELREKRDRDQRRITEQELRQAEERFSKAFQVSPIGITISSSEGYFLSVNDAFRRMLDANSGEIVGRTAFELDIWVNQDDQELLDTSNTSKKPVRDAEIIIQTVSKKTKYVTVSTEFIEVSQENCVLAMWQDITGRKQAEQTLKQNTELIQLLQVVTVAANEADNINELLQFAIDRICEYANWPLGHVYLLSRGTDTQLISSKIWYCSDPEKYGDFQRRSERIHFDKAVGGLVHRVFMRQAPEWILGLQPDSKFLRANMTLEVGLQSVFAFPIFAQHDVVAIMEFFSTKADEPHLALLDTIPHIAAQIGHMIEREWSNSEIRALYQATGYLFNAESIHELSQQIVRGVVQEFQQVDCGLLLVDQQLGKINRMARAGEYQVDLQAPLELDGPGLVPRAIREDRIIYSPDVQKDEEYIPNVPTTLSEMVVPLKTRDGIIGVLDLQSRQRDYFNQRDQRILAAFAERAAAALEITRLYEELNQYAAQLELRVEERTQELQKAKERVEAILNNSSDAIILVDGNGAIQQTNPRFVQVVGYNYDELFGASLSRIMTLENGEDLSEILASVSHNHEYRRAEAIVRRKNGTSFPTDAAFAIFARNHETGIVCSLRDISEQKQLEQELRSAFERQKELADLKTRFISTVSHEYRTPLAIIQTSTTLLQRYSERMTPEKKQDQFEKILGNVRRLTDLLDDVLQISRAETMGVAFNPHQLDIAKLFKEMIDDIQQIHTHHHIDFTIVGEPKSIAGDEKLLRQIVSNLLSNAIKYSPGQGTVHVTLEFEESEVRLLVRDEGMGIPPEDLEKLFTLFHRAQNVGQIQGSGLGLAIVKQAVEAHNATITVQSEVGTGTTFTIVFPVEV